MQAIFSPDQNYACREDDCRASSRSPFFPFVCLLLMISFFPTSFFWRIYLPIRRNQRCFCWHTRKCYMTNQVIYMYIYAIIYKLNYVCYMIDGLNHWNYGSGHDMYSEKRAPCFPRGHFARWCLHGLSKRPWLTAPKDEFFRYNMLPSDAAEICFLLLAILFVATHLFLAVIHATKSLFHIHPIHSSKKYLQSMCVLQALATRITWRLELREKNWCVHTCF